MLNIFFFLTDNSHAEHHFSQEPSAHLQDSSPADSDMNGYQSIDETISSPDQLSDKEDPQDQLSAAKNSSETLSPLQQTFIIFFNERQYEYCTFLLRQKENLTDEEKACLVLALGKDFNEEVIDIGKSYVADTSFSYMSTVYYSMATYKMFFYKLFFVLPYTKSFSSIVEDTINLSFFNSVDLREAEEYIDLALYWNEQAGQNPCSPVYKEDLLKMKKAITLVKASNLFIQMNFYFKEGNVTACKFAHDKLNSSYLMEYMLLKKMITTEVYFSS